MLKDLDDVLEEFANEQLSPADSAGHQMVDPAPTRNETDLLAAAMAPRDGSATAPKLPAYVRHS